MPVFDLDNLPEREEDIDFSDIEAKYQVPYEDGYDTLIVVDNLPIVEEAKEEKLLIVIKKIFKSVGYVKEGGIWMPTGLNEEGQRINKGYVHRIAFSLSGTTCPTNELDSNWVVWVIC